MILLKNEGERFDLFNGKVRHRRARRGLKCCNSSAGKAATIYEHSRWYSRRLEQFRVASVLFEKSKVRLLVG